MKVLAIDTSSNVATVAVMDDEKLICEYTLNHKKTHSQKLMPMIQEVLKSCELEAASIDLFAVAVGPGSFTGLRIGVATAKALAHSLDKPIVGVSTLDALAYGIPFFNGVICPILDAKRDQVYTGVYKWENDIPKPITEYLAISIDELMQKLQSINEKVIFVGDGVYQFKQIILNKLGNLADFAPKHSIMQRASMVAELALKKFYSGNTDNYMTLTPYYLRKSQAERLYENARTT